MGAEEDGSQAVAIGGIGPVEVPPTAWKWASPPEADQVLGPGIAGIAQVEQVAWLPPAGETTGMAAPLPDVPGSTSTVEDAAVEIAAGGGDVAGVVVVTGETSDTAGDGGVGLCTTAEIMSIIAENCWSWCDFMAANSSLTASWFAWIVLAVFASCLRRRSRILLVSSASSPRPFANVGVTERVCLLWKIDVKKINHPIPP